MERSSTIVLNIWLRRPRDSGPVVALVVACRAAVWVGAGNLCDVVKPLPPLWIGLVVFFHAALVSGMSEKCGELSLAKVCVSLKAELRVFGDSLEEILIAVELECHRKQVVPLFLREHALNHFNVRLVEVFLGKISSRVR